MTGKQAQGGPEKLIEQEVKTFAAASPLNRMPDTGDRKAAGKLKKVTA